jgi:hypothetical protein
VRIVNKFLNQNKATAVYIAVTEQLLVRQFNKTTNVANEKNANGLETIDS